MTDIQTKAINTIRILSAEAVQKANSGHPGTPIALAPIAYTLWTKFLKHNPKNSSWLNRDRLVLSCGHASMLLYSMLHLTGYKLSLADLKQFRQWQSKTPGHPEVGHTDGVETTTGPLGQGISNAVGFAIAEQMAAKKFNQPDFPIIDHFTYVIASDGDLMEGISHEACSIAGHLKLNKLIVFYDDNHITIDGNTSLAFSENVMQRFEAYGWHVQLIKDGNNDVGGMEQVIKEAQHSDKPSLIVLKTTIAYGAPHKQDTTGAHGAPLGEDEIKLLKKHYSWEHEEAFVIPNDVKKHYNSFHATWQESENTWNELYKKYQEKYPEHAKELEQFRSGKLPAGWEKELPNFEGNDALATRKASGTVLQKLSKAIPNLVQGSADLHPSTNTYFKDFPDFQAAQRDGRNLHYGVREHGMGAIQNGIALYGLHIPLCSTFLVFADYMRPTIRLAAIMKTRSIFVYTHDSIGVGEDGPTHQPIEQATALRAIPNNIVLRPADGNETSTAWKIALERTDGPTCILLTRQNLPTLKGTFDTNHTKAAKGAYVVADADSPDLILIASGSELHLGVEAKKQLDKEGIKTRVVSMMSMELFEEQDEKYKESILPQSVAKRISVEAGISQGWEKYIGNEGTAISIEHYGASAPGSRVLGEFGFTVDNVVEQAQKLVKNK